MELRITISEYAQKHPNGVPTGEGRDDRKLTYTEEDLLGNDLDDLEFWGVPLEKGEPASLEEEVARRLASYQFPPSLGHVPEWSTDARICHSHTGKSWTKSGYAILVGPLGEGFVARVNQLLKDRQ